MCAASRAGKGQKFYCLQAQYRQAGPPGEPGQPSATLPEGKWLDWHLEINQTNSCVYLNLVLPNFNFISTFLCS